MMLWSLAAALASPLTFTESGHVLVEARVNGTGPHRFVLDTGANISMFDPALTGEVKVLRTLDAHGAGGVAEMHLVGTMTVEVGGAERRLGYALSTPMAEFDDVAPGLMGVLGLDVMRQALVRIDVPGGTVDWNAPQPEGKGIKLGKARGRLLEAELELEGGPVRGIVDLGAATTVLNPLAAAVAGGVARPQGSSVEGIDGTRSDSTTHDLPSCGLWGLVVAPCTADVSDLDVFETLRMDGEAAAIIGSDLLAARPFTLDAKRRRLWVP